jgi:hypothetical protein
MGCCRLLIARYPIRQYQLMGDDLTASPTTFLRHTVSTLAHRDLRLDN